MTKKTDRHISPEYTSPYPVSRLAPAFNLVDLAKEIAQADEMLANRAGSQLKIIAEQMAVLQQQAKSILEQTARDQQIHRAQCNFQKKPGQIYHLYQNRHGGSILSMLSPDDWQGKPPNQFIGSYRLESDRSWTPCQGKTIEEEDNHLKVIHHLLSDPL
ncbi:MAG: hypothetical protein B6D70_13735 [gamma proteobacterium symbiont of Stewartia floridana]|nr:DUF2452 domain-containing protein [Candidatus Thiodiazotropha taylori]RLW53303.1 MAG: hypothetical protein B6D76_12070 [gamma proteobacterium symbiont of Stewartia floridana]MCG7909219.1 DUF2452 domain-containing protein [Candidatus Thiodiazotropha taylori]MCG7918869.1 DUF2452 domain-containing protein [Candidatus Thiodiazotropha taylori]MCG7959469.1 DUF2452 domain-containing protein [Candidatus Thiodiazotropha taylori]